MRACFAEREQVLLLIELVANACAIWPTGHQNCH